MHTFTHAHIHTHTHAHTHTLTHAHTPEGEGGMENDEDLEPTDTVPWMGTDRDYTYDEVHTYIQNLTDVSSKSAQ